MPWRRVNRFVSREVGVAVATSALCYFGSRRYSTPLSTLCCPPHASYSLCLSYTPPIPLLLSHPPPFPRLLHISLLSLSLFIILIHLSPSRFLSATPFCEQLSPPPPPPVPRSLPLLQPDLQDLKSSVIYSLTLNHYGRSTHRHQSSLTIREPASQSTSQPTNHCALVCVVRP